MKRLKIFWDKTVGKSRTKDLFHPSFLQKLSEQAFRVAKSRSRYLLWKDLVGVAECESTIIFYAEFIERSLHTSHYAIHKDSF